MSVVEFPYWRRQDEVAKSLAILEDRDLGAFKIADSGGRQLLAPSMTAAVRAAWMMQQEGSQGVIILYRPSCDEEYDMAAAVDVAIEESYLREEENSG